MKKLIVLFTLLVCSFSAFAQGAYSVEETDIGTLMEDPKAKAILQKYLPTTINNDQFTMAYGFTLSFIQGFDQTGELTDENLAKINEELGHLSSPGDK